MNPTKEVEGIVGQLGRSYWYHVFLASTLLLGILMLFIKEIPSPLRDYLIPALTVYSLGTAIVGYVQGVQYRKNGMNKDWCEPTVRYALAHALWFSLLIGYLFYRHVV